MIQEDLQKELDSLVSKVNASGFKITQDFKLVDSKEVDKVYAVEWKFRDVDSFESKDGDTIQFYK